MARSYRSPYVAFVRARSERKDKKVWHGRMRAHVRTRLASCKDFDEFIDVRVRDVSDTWSMRKDGSVCYVPDLVVRRGRRSLKIVRAPWWITNKRAAYRVLGK